MGMTSVYLEDELQKTLRERGMTIRGAVKLGLEATKQRLESNDLIVDLQQQNKELRRRIEFLAAAYANGRQENEV